MISKAWVPFRINMWIALTGPRHSGKDTLADMLVAHHGFQKGSFATPLKNHLQHIFGLSHDQLHDPQQKEAVDPRYGKSPREMMQLYGTNFMRNMIKDDFWTCQFEEMHRETPLLVVSDLRFPNEEAMVRRHGGLVIGITRPSVSRASVSDVHESETQSISCDVVIENTGTPDQLYDRFLQNMRSPNRRIVTNPHIANPFYPPQDG